MNPFREALIADRDERMHLTLEENVEQRLQTVATLSPFRLEQPSIVNALPRPDRLRLVDQLSGEARAIDVSCRDDRVWPGSHRPSVASAFLLHRTAQGMQKRYTLAPTPADQLENLGRRRRSANWPAAGTPENAARDGGSP